MFTSFVNTLKEDLEAIRGDLDEFVTTVREDASAVLGVRLKGSTSSSSRFHDTLSGDLLCKPLPTDASAPEDLAARKEEVEKLLGGLEGPQVPDLYRELVPSRVTHQEFFERLFYYRGKFLAAERLKMQQGTLSRHAVEQEELEGWDDDEDEDEQEDGEEDESEDKQQPVPRTRRANKESEELAGLKRRVQELEQALELCERQKEDLQRALQKLKPEDGASTKSWEAVSGEEVTGDTPAVNDSALEWE
jgi:hypothetical protein